MSISSEKLLSILKSGFVSSCQPVDDGPMDTPEIVAAMAQASIAGGAIAVRIEGVDKVKATREKISAPIIGIVKRDLENSPVRITPFIEDVEALAEAGADIIAIDATFRDRPVEVETLIKAIHKAGRIAMLDCSNYDEAMEGFHLGAEIIGTTLSGYVGDSVPKEPDFAFVSALKKSGCFVMAEGRYNSPELARNAILAGADCVTVGSAITRVEHICTWFSDAISSAREQEVKL